MASQGTLEFYMNEDKTSPNYGKLEGASRARIVAATAIHSTDGSSGLDTLLSPLQVYEGGVREPGVILTDHEIYKEACGVLGLKPGAKVPVHNHGRVVGRNKKARISYGSAYETEKLAREATTKHNIPYMHEQFKDKRRYLFSKKELDEIIRDAVYNLEENGTIRGETTVGLHPYFTVKANLVTTSDNKINLFNWYANFNSQLDNTRYKDTLPLKIADINVVANPHWDSKYLVERLGLDKDYANFYKDGMVIVDQNHNTIYILGMRYFGEYKKGTLTLAWTSAVKNLGGVAVHGGIRELDFTLTKETQYHKFGKKIQTFLSLSGGGKSSHTNNKTNSDTLPSGTKATVIHDDAYVIFQNLEFVKEAAKKRYNADESAALESLRKNLKLDRIEDIFKPISIALESALFDKNDKRYFGNEDFKYLVSAQNCTVVMDKDGKRNIVGGDARNPNDRAIFNRDLLGNYSNSCDVPSIVGLCMKDSVMPPIYKIDDPVLANAMAATLLTMPTAAENLTEEEMKTLVIVPYANPFRVYSLLDDVRAFGGLLSNENGYGNLKTVAYGFNSGGFFISEDSINKKTGEEIKTEIPLKISHRLQTAITLDEIEWEPWNLVPGISLPTKESIDKIFENKESYAQFFTNEDDKQIFIKDGYNGMYNPQKFIQKKKGYRRTLHNRFDQRTEFLRKHPDLKNTKELLELLEKLVVI